MENTTINGYKLKYKLGEGGMAEVWYAENSLQKTAAVKILQQRFCGMPEIVSRFENEAKVMVQLSHPHIRNIYDYSTVNGCPCMVMEYLEGKDLSQRLKEGERFSNEQLAAWWNDLVDALQYTHRKNIIHRDIKPSNLFITEDGRIKVLDFGIAKVRDNITVTQTGARMGTLMYMSPEQVYDIKNLDYKTDVYSLAITFYHLITGKAPYDSTKVSDFEIQENIVRKNVDTSILPEPWRNLLAGYLNKTPEMRNELRKIDSNNEASAIDETFIFTPEQRVKNSPAFLPPPRRKRNWPPVFVSLLIIIGLIFLALNQQAAKSFLKNIFSGKAKKEVVAIPKPIKKPVTETPVIIPPPDTTNSIGDGGTNDQVITSVNLAERERIIKNIVNDYYRSRSDCNAMYRFFKDTVKQYYNKSNVKIENLVKECEQYHNKWQYIEADINNESYVFTHQQDGTSYADFNMLYKIKKAETDDWIPYNIDVSLVIDADNKIIRIVERKIEKL